jgi:hypothetical protein
MPRPDGVDLETLFGPVAPPDSWTQWVDQQMFFVHGLGAALRLVGSLPHRRCFLPLLERVAAERKLAGWEKAIPATTWTAFGSANQINRFVEVRNNTFTTAASGILAIELFLKDHGFAGDIYSDPRCFIVPQDSYVTGLTRPTFLEICNLIRRQQKKSWEEYLFGETGQPHRLFEEMINGRLVTRALANDVLTIIHRFNPSFEGTVSQNFADRRKSLEELRRRERESDDTRGQSRYKRKITGASFEIYLA